MASFATTTLTAPKRDEDADLWEMRDECRAKPKNLPLRLSLGDLLMERGDPRSALDVYREALRMKPNYTKAKRKVAQAEEAVAELPPVEGAEDDTSVATGEELSPEASAVVEAAKLKAKGNSHFNNGCYVNAWEDYSDAIDALKAAAVPPRKEDAKLHTNRAACLLTAERWVPAAYDGHQAIRLDDEWWKGYWYRGQALLGQLKGKRPSKVMQQKAEVALKALERASQCKNFPEDKRERVEQLQARARNIVFYLAQNQCPTS